MTQISTKKSLYDVHNKITCVHDITYTHTYQDQHFLIFSFKQGNASLRASGNCQDNIVIL